MYMNYILNPKVSAEITNYLCYPKSNKAGWARTYTQKEMLKSSYLYS